VRRFAIGDFQRIVAEEPGKNYPGTNFELLYQRKVFGAVVSSFLCHVIVADHNGQGFFATYGPKIRAAPEYGVTPF
jgi:hypothetical protein